MLSKETAKKSGALRGQRRLKLFISMTGCRQRRTPSNCQETQRASYSAECIRRPNITTLRGRSPRSGPFPQNRSGESAGFLTVVPTVQVETGFENKKALRNPATKTFGTFAQNQNRPAQELTINEGKKDEHGGAPAPLLSRSYRFLKTTG